MQLQPPRSEHRDFTINRVLCELSYTDAQLRSWYRGLELGVGCECCNNLFTLLEALGIAGFLENGSFDDLMHECEQLRIGLCSRFAREYERVNTTQRR